MYVLQKHYFNEIHQLQVHYFWNIYEENRILVLQSSNYIAAHNIHFSYRNRQMLFE